MKTLKQLVQASLLSSSIVAPSIAADWQTDVNTWAVANGQKTYAPAVTIGIDENATPGYDAGLDRKAPPSMPFGVENVLTDGTDRMTRNYSNIPFFYGEVSVSGQSVDELYISVNEVPEGQRYVVGMYIDNVLSKVTELHAQTPVDITGHDAYFIMKLPRPSITFNDGELILHANNYSDASLVVYSSANLEGTPDNGFERVGVMHGDTYKKEFRKPMDKPQEFFIIGVQP